MFDCQACGACCANSQPNKDEDYFDYVEVLAADRLSKEPAHRLRKLTVLNPAGERHLRLVGEDQRCIALTGEVGVSVGCGIYALRPKPCHRVQPGDRECRVRRREWRIA